MLNERVQMLISAEQRRRLEAEAKLRGTSVAALIREAIDARFRTVETGDRLQALEDIRAMRGRFRSPEELNEIAGSERADLADRVAPRDT